MQTRRTLTRTLLLTAGLLLLAVCQPAGPEEPQTTSRDYSDLLQLFQDWREFQKPPLIDGVYDYSAGAMADHYRRFAGMRNRLRSIDPSDWPIPQQVDFHLVRAEMNGLDFDHRIRRPWSQNPAFYVTIFMDQSDVPAHEGPVADGWIDIWLYDFPLDAESASELASRIGIIPAVLERARTNLAGSNARDLWVLAVRSFRRQARELADLAEQARDFPSLAGSIAQARQASADFADWLEAEAPGKTGPSGIGRDNYTWYLNHVQLIPYTWEEEVTLMRRELARSQASLRLEEHRNRRLPELERFSTSEQYDRELNAAVDEFMRFLVEEDIVTVRDYMEPAQRAKTGRFSPAEGLRGFFSEVNYRDGLVMRTHNYHWIELARIASEPHPNPIRREAPLYNIYAGRSEGLATGMEEMLMHAGLFDKRPQARELIWILVAQRAARALAGLRLHANEFNVEQASEFASKWTPRGWMPPDSNTVIGEQHLYLQQPSYGTSYLIGKHELENLMAERALQQGDQFTLRGFMDEVAAAGVIPVSLLRWELTGNDDEIRHLRSQ